MSNVALAVAQRLREAEDVGSQAKITLRLNFSASRTLDSVAESLKMSRTGAATHLFLAALSEAADLLSGHPDSEDELNRIKADLDFREAFSEENLSLHVESVEEN